MEDILASIRRILDEENGRTGAPPPAPAVPDPEDEVLDLDPSMMVGPDPDPPEPAPPEPDPPEPAPPDHLPAAALPAAPVSAPVPLPVASPAPGPDPRPVSAPLAAAAPPAPGPAPARLQAAPSGFAAPILAPETEEAAAGAVSTLMQALVRERSAAIHRSGPTIEDLVRAELRPLLKAWLDQHLAATVERLVRAEIERVVNRHT